MNPNITPVYAGLDIAKASLQLHLQSKSYDLPNAPAGHVQLIKRLAAIPGLHVICEATGGYERASVAALHAVALPVSVLNPARVRQFARASGELAKTDPIDAAVLTAFGQAFAPEPTPPRTATELKLAALVTRRVQTARTAGRRGPARRHLCRSGFAQTLHPLAGPDGKTNHQS